MKQIWSNGHFWQFFLDYFTQFSLSWKFDIFHRRNFIPTLDHRVQGFETPFSAAKKKVFLFPMIDLDEEEALYREDQWPFSLPDFSTNSVWDSYLFLLLNLFLFLFPFLPNYCTNSGKSHQKLGSVPNEYDRPKKYPKIPRMRRCSTILSPFVYQATVPIVGSLEDCLRENHQ